MSKFREIWRKYGKIGVFGVYDPLRPPLWKIKELFGSLGLVFGRISKLEAFRPYIDDNGVGIFRRRLLLRKF